MDDALIIGGGIIGCAVALSAHQRGLAVRILDRGEPGGGSTPRAFGLVDVLSPAPPAYLRARSAAITETEDWLMANGATAAVGWSRCGSLNPALAPRDQATFTRAGITATWWDAEQLHAAEPALDLPGAMHLPDDACLNPRAYLDAAIVATRRAGIPWIAAAANPPVRQGDAWVAGDARARQVVIAAGVWSPALLPGLPVHPVRGTVLITPPLPPMLTRYTPDLRQLPDGRIWIGGAHEDAGLALEPSPDVMAAIWQRATGCLPALAGTQPVAVRTGLRPMPADGLPLAGPWPGAPGLFVCVTHSGVTMAQWLGRRLAALLAGDPAPELEPFGVPRR